MKYDILINLATLKKGGGQNRALNFLSGLSQKGWLNNFSYTVARNSDIHIFLKSRDVNDIILMPNNPILRMLKEFIIGKLILHRHNIKLIYSYSGIGLYPKSTFQISGSTDSNIYFPEIDFRNEHKGLGRLIITLIDNYRRWGLKQMDGIIFQNKLMEERCKELYQINNTVFIKPSIDTSYDETEYVLPKKANNSSYIGLFFCGWQKHKNFMIIPELSAVLRQNNIDFHFILTAEENHSEDHKSFLKEIEKWNVKDNVSIVGRLNKSQIASLYNQVDYVFLLSKLESFSNNIIESWFFKRPLIIADENWSRSICMDGAIYVKRNDVSNIVKNIQFVIKNDNYKKQIITNGVELLKEYPNNLERTEQEVKYLIKVYENL